MRNLILVLALALSAVVLGPAQADAATNYKKIVDLTFPVDGRNSYTDSFDDCRSGCDRYHRATDIMAASGTPVHHAMGGTVGWMSTPATSSCGYCVFVKGDDGREYAYIHLGPKKAGQASKAYVKGLERGDRVDRGDLLGWVGCSGNASCTAPHLHFSIDDPAVVDPYGSNYINPYFSLRAAEAEGDLPGILQGAGFVFTDVPLNSTHAVDIQKIAQAGITKGCGSNRFCPTRPVTREQMASFLVRATSLSPIDGSRFSDVSSNNVHHRNIAALAESGITQGCGGDRFCPESVVTRQQMASFLVRALHLPPASTGTFSDVPHDSRHAGDIAALAAAGITKGCGGDKFCPTAPVTRQQMASFLARAFLP